MKEGRETGPALTRPERPRRLRFTLVEVKREAAGRNQRPAPPDEIQHRIEAGPGKTLGPGQQQDRACCDVDAGEFCKCQLPQILPARQAGGGISRAVKGFRVFDRPDRVAFRIEPEPFQRRRHNLSRHREAVGSRGVADLGDPDRFVDAVLPHQRPEIPDAQRKLGFRCIPPLIGMKIHHIEIRSGPRPQRCFDKCRRVAEIRNSGEQNPGLRVDPPDHRGSLFEQFGVVCAIRLFSPRTIAVGFVDDFVTIDPPLVTGDALFHITQPGFQFTEGRLAVRGHFAAENRQHFDVPVFRFGNDFVPTCEVPLSRLRLDLFPVEIGAD